VADKIPVPVVASLAAGIVFLATFALVFAPYESCLSSSDVTRDNPYGIDAQVAYAHAFSGISCPALPCDTSGIVLKMVSTHDVIVIGYEVCDISSTCVYFDGRQATHVFGASKGIDNSIRHTDGITSYLGKKSNWKIGDAVSVKVRVAPAIEKLENNITSWHVDPNKPAVWLDVGHSKILALDVI
jgi:hypothetical protein